MKNFLNIFLSITLSLILLTSVVSIELQQQANAQNTEESPTSTTEEIKTIFWYLDKEQ